MQSKNVSKKTRKMTNDPATSAAELAAPAEATMSSRTSRTSKAKKTETTELGGAKHRKVKPTETVELVQPSEVIAAAAGVGTTSAAFENASTADIARLAYSFWEARGFEHGWAEEDWLRAERELLAKR